MNNSNNELKVRNSAKINGMIYHELWNEKGNEMKQSIKALQAVIDSSNQKLYRETSLIYILRLILALMKLS